jgi:hypothetical protein
MNFQSAIEKQVEFLFPNHSIPITEDILKGFHVIPEIIEANDEVYKNRSKYRLTWALSNAQNDLDTLLQAVFSCNKTAHISSKDLVNIKGIKKEIGPIQRRHIKSMKNIYAITSMAISLIDIAVSIVLVLLISKVGHFTESLFDSAILGTLFFSFIILLKVSLDRFVILPRVHHWGWANFKKINKSFERNSATIVASLIISKYLIAHDQKKKIPPILKKARKILITTQ